VTREGDLAGVAMRLVRPGSAGDASARRHAAARRVAASGAMTVPSRASPEDVRAARLRLEAGPAAVEIAPGVGGRIAALEVDGWDLLRRHGWTDREWGAFVMAPWVGRLRLGQVRWQGRTWSMPVTEPPHAIHGTVAATAWTATAVTTNEKRIAFPTMKAWRSSWASSIRALRRAIQAAAMPQITSNTTAPPSRRWAYGPWDSRPMTRYGSASTAAKSIVVRAVRMSVFFVEQE